MLVQHLQFSSFKQFGKTVFKIIMWLYYVSVIQDYIQLLSSLHERDTYTLKTVKIYYIVMTSLRQMALHYYHTYCTEVIR